MNNQEAFDHITTSLYKQNTKSQNPGGSCLYRGPNGTKCAAGHILPDEVYHPEWENLPVRYLYARGAFPDFTGDIEFLEDMQEVHDFNPPEYWPKKFRKVAKKWGLNHA